MASNSTAEEPLVRAYRCMPDGSATPLEWEEAKRAFSRLRKGKDDSQDPEAGWIWLHLDRSDALACRWLQKKAGLSDELAEALTADDTRPRAAQIDDGALLILRARNRQAKSARKPMVSLRMFVAPGAVLSVRLKPFLPTYEMAARIEAGVAPPSPGAFVGRLVEITMAEIEDTLDRLDARLERLEGFAFSAPSGQLRARRNDLNKLRRAVMAMRRFMRPRSEALRDYAGFGVDVAPEDERPGLREAAVQAARVADDLDALQEGAGLINDEMQARIAERLNNTIVKLTAVSTVFLPLTFATGLLGVNLAGIPFHEREWAFGVFAIILAITAGGAVLILQRLGR